MIAPAMRYEAIIRAYECTALLIEVVAKLRAQTHPPERVVIVDSSDDAATSAAFADYADVVVAYGNAPFNYSRAINLGVAAATQPYVLVISSHVVLRDPGLIARGFADAAKSGTSIFFYWQNADGAPERLCVVTRRTFNGRNGLANSMAMVPTQDLRARPFREEVFSCEDQEWTRHYLVQPDRSMLRIETPGLSYRNPHHSHSDNRNEVKIFNEELAIGYFVRRRLLWPDRIVLRIMRGMRAYAAGDAQTVTARLLPRLMRLNDLDDFRVVDDGLKEVIPFFR